MSAKNTPPFKAASSSKLTTRPSTVTIASTGPGRRVTNKQRFDPQTAVKDRKTVARSKINKKSADETIAMDSGLPEFDTEYRQIAYGKFLRAMLEDCLVKEKIERESTGIDVQITHLAKRFQQTIEQLDETNRRMKDISFLSEQKRLLDLKNQDCSKLYDFTDNANSKELIKSLNTTQQASLDPLQNNNVDFGYDKDSGHKQLLDAVNDAITGLEEIKNHSELDMHKFTEYDKIQTNLEDLDESRKNLENMKNNFEKKFPEFNEKLWKQLAEALSKTMDSDQETDD